MLSEYGAAASPEMRGTLAQVTCTLREREGGRREREGGRREREGERERGERARERERERERTRTPERFRGSAAWHRV